MAKPSNTRQHSGSAFKMLRSYDFSSTKDKCKIACNVQILEPTTRGGRFTDGHVIAGRDPRHKSIRFLSLLTKDTIPAVPLTTLDKVLKESRGESPKYWQKDKPYIQDAKRLLKHMKDLIQIYC